MLSRPLFRAATRCFALSSTYLHVRAMSSFTLDNNIFNPALYQRVQDVWLAGVDVSGEEVNMDVVRRWFMGTPDERLALDKKCSDNFLHALDAVGPAQLTTLTAEPFLSQLADLAQNDSKGDGAEAASAALSIAIFLDQMPRNIFRTNEGLVKVYTHYDKISQAFIRTLFSPASPIPRPDQHPLWRNSTAHRMWFYMPLCHSEDVEVHKQMDGLLDDLQRDLNAQPGCAGSKKLLEEQYKAEREHREIIDKFGRYPHRNGALRRESTEEEIEFMSEGGKTFGVAQKEGKKKDEL
ncbi:hypothetical protein N0V91_006875 [Didymella pomorum]|jgi:uncharacterized protein (DUF924 family)|uniref:DUF924-domain-containing protein n=1 Tax=Didymella pomorum TaxID=749634 RepID=A0A9W8Z9N3_9PLEO|nr:hypothetical protein N0V91_006875 [Didymella pomorum]